MSAARILVPPGIGDGYWVLVKLRGFMLSHGITRADIWIHDSSPRRAHGMWQRVPFVRYAGYAGIPPKARNKLAIKRAYRTANFPVQRNVCGFDYFLSFNGALDAGRSLDQAMPGRTNWYEPAFDPRLRADYEQMFRARFGSYVVAAFWEHGFYGKWVREFPEADIVRTLATLADAGKTVVVMGAAWDKGSIADRLVAADARFVSLVGDTDFDQLTGLLSGAEAILGFPAGNTLLGPYFRRPTVLLWNRHFPAAFWRNACPPDAALYRPMDTAGATPESVSAQTLALIADRAKAA